MDLRVMVNGMTVVEGDVIALLLLRALRGEIEGLHLRDGDSIQVFAEVKTEDGGRGIFEKFVYVDEEEH